MPTGSSLSLTLKTSAPTPLNTPPDVYHQGVSDRNGNKTQGSWLRDKGVSTTPPWLQKPLLLTQRLAKEACDPSPPTFKISTEVTPLSMVTKRGEARCMTPTALSLEPLSLGPQQEAVWVGMNCLQLQAELPGSWVNLASRHRGKGPGKTSRWG